MKLIKYRLGKEGAGLKELLKKSAGNYTQKNEMPIEVQYDADKVRRLRDQILDLFYKERVSYAEAHKAIELVERSARASAIIG